jgi:hypothetical protein
MTPRARSALAALLVLVGCSDGGTDPVDTASDTEPGEVVYLSDYRLQVAVEVLEGQVPLEGDPDISLWLQPPGEPHTLHPVTPGRPTEGLPPLPAGTTVGLLVESGGDPDVYEPDRVVAFGQTVLDEALELGGQERTASMFLPLVADVGVLSRFGGDDQRAAAGVALLDDGRVYVFGGTPADRLNGGIKPAATRSVYRLSIADPDEREVDLLSLVLPEVELANRTSDDKRVSLTATSYTASDGSQRILVAGGRSEYVSLDVGTSSALVFDPATESFEADLQMPEARSEHYALPLADGRIFLDGGFIDDATFTTSATIFDPDGNRFTSIELGNEVGGWARAGASLGTEGVLVCGGAKPPLFSPQTSDWPIVDGCVRVTLDERVVPAAPLPEPLAGHVLTPLADGRVLCTGGNTGELEASDVPPDAVRSAYVYDVGRDSWEQIDNLAGPRAGHAVVPLPNGDAVVVGGVSGVAIGHNGLTGTPPACAERFLADEDGFETLLDCANVGIGSPATVAAHPSHGAVVFGGLHLAPDGAESAEAIGLVGLGPASP